MENNPIPIRNLFYLLCYAWNVLPILNDVKVGEEDISDAYNLLARVFTYGIGKLIKSGFHRSYVSKQEELKNIKGKIDVNESVKCVANQSQSLICNYDEYSENDTFNQILKYTIDFIVKNKMFDSSIRHDLKKLSIFFAEIDSLAPTKENRTKLVFSRNNVTYRMLIQISIMLYENTFVNEDAGKIKFKDFFRSEQMHKVFEIFILNFYSMHLDKKIYKVHAPKIKWKIDETAHETWDGLFAVDDDYGDRRTDIVVENKNLNLQIIMDAKYYHNTFVKSYMSNEEEDSIRDSHIRQVREYLIDSEYPGTKIGALIYPMTNSNLKNGRIKNIQGTPIVYKTINLADDWENIETDMLEFIRKFEKGLKRKTS